MAFFISYSSLTPQDDCIACLMGHFWRRMNKVPFDTVPSVLFDRENRSRIVTTPAAPCRLLNASSISLNFSSAVVERILALYRAIAAAMSAIGDDAFVMIRLFSV
ncbi:MAG: hypothetical protein AAGF59_12095 [Pseudomonadota bacterium]